MGRKTTRNPPKAGGMFTEFEPAPAPAAAATVPMFEMPENATVTLPQDYGQAAAPVREAKADALFGLVLAVDENTGALNLGLDL